MVYVKILSSSAKQPRCSCTTAVLCQPFSAVGHVPLAARGAKGWTGYGPRSGVATVATSLVESVFNTGERSPCHVISRDACCSIEYHELIITW